MAFNQPHFPAFLQSPPTVSCQTDPGSLSTTEYHSSSTGPVLDVSFYTLRGPIFHVRRSYPREEATWRGHGEGMRLLSVSAELEFPTVPPSTRHLRDHTEHSSTCHHDGSLSQYHLEELLICASQLP